MFPQNRIEYQMFPVFSHPRDINSTQTIRKQVSEHSTTSLQTGNIDTGQRGVGEKFRDLPGTVFTAAKLLAKTIQLKKIVAGDTYVTPTFFVRLAILSVY